MPRTDRPTSPSRPRVRLSLVAALVGALLGGACRDDGPPVDPETGRPLAPPASQGPSPSPRPIQAVPADRDADGLGDADDHCPDEPEDRDGFDDVDGCPDPDNDRDGVLDVDDQCPNDPMVMGPNCQVKTGCPDDCRPAQRVAPS